MTRRTLAFAAVAVAAWVVGLALTSGCRAPDPKEPATGGYRPEKATREAVSNIVERQTRKLDKVSMLKPSGPEGLHHALAPLLLEEVRQTPSSPADLRPVVYWVMDTVRTEAGPRPRLGYWWHPPSAQANASGPAQGVRVTLNAEGQPVIWEVLRDDSGLSIVYVSRSLEERARRQFGAPLPGRRFSIERAVSESPRTIVPRVLEDGPMPMGPIVYLERGGGTVQTVACRCMPAQAREVVSTDTYDLAPGTALPRPWPDPELRWPEGQETTRPVPTSRQFRH